MWPLSYRGVGKGREKDSDTKTGTERERQKGGERSASKVTGMSTLYIYANCPATENEQQRTEHKFDCVVFDRFKVFSSNVPVSEFQHVPTRGTPGEWPRVRPLKARGRMAADKEAAARKSHAANTRRPILDCTRGWNYKIVSWIIQVYELRSLREIDGLARCSAR